jgi:hypothetical protein
MFFFCRGEPVADADLQACFPSDAVVPTLPAQNWLTLLRSEVKIEGPLEPEVPDEVVQVEGIMKGIDRQLRRHFQGVTGIAFPHYAAEATSE